jgi:hypothetical protein
MTGAWALLLDPDPKRVLVTIDPHFDDPQGVTRALAFAPQRLPRPAEKPSLGTFDRARERFVVHMRQHENVAGPSVGHHASNQPVAIELRRKNAPLFYLVIG